MRAVPVVAFMAFRLGESRLPCISDAGEDLMRIIAPVKRIEEATSEELLAALHQ